MNYYFHKRPVGNVSLFVYTKGERCELSTGVRLDDADLHRTEGYITSTKEGREVNNILFSALNKVNELVILFKNANDNNEPNAKELKSLYNRQDHTVPTLKLVISIYGKDMSNGIVTKSNGHVLSDWTKRNAVSVVKTLINKLNKDVLNERLGSTIVGTPAKARVFADRIIKRLAKFGYEDKSISSYLRHVRDSMKWYDAKFGTTLSTCRSSINISVNSKQVNLITKEESDFIINNFENIKSIECKNSNESDALELWLCALLLGQRSGDMQSWTTKNLYEKPNGSVWINFRQSKTNQLIDLPVFPELLNVFNRNASRLGGNIMPTLNNVSLHMKAIAKRLPIFDYDYKREVWIGGKLTYKPGKRWEFINLHEMRGACITNMLESGVDELTVKSFSGHTVNSAGFSRYVKIRDDVKSKALEQMMNNVACDKIKETKVVNL